MQQFKDLLRFHGKANLEEAFEKLFTTINFQFLLDNSTSENETTWICDITDQVGKCARSQITHDDDEIGQKLAVTGAFLSYSEEKRKEETNSVNVTANLFKTSPPPSVKGDYPDSYLGWARIFPIGIFLCFSLSAQNGG